MGLSILIPISRSQAKQLNLKRFYTGEPCKNGHIAERRVSDNRCVECVKAWKNSYLGTEKEKINRRRYDSSEKGRAAQKRYRSSDKRKASVKRYNSTEKGKASARRANRSEKGRASRKRFDQTDKGRACSIRNSHARRARMAGQDCIQYSYEDRIIRFELFDNRCVYCGSAEDLTEDHFIPLAKAGPHQIENIVPACISCNKRKNAQDPMAWFIQQPFYSAERWDTIISHVQNGNG